MSNELKEVRVRLKLVDGETLTSNEQIASPDDAIKVMKPFLSELDRESLVTVNLDTKNHPINFNVVSIGDTAESMVPIQNIFKSSILSNATKVMMFHNHPSGDITPSNHDLVATANAILAGRLMNIEVLDHIIIGNGNDEYYSIMEKNKDILETPERYSNLGKLITEANNKSTLHEIDNYDKEIILENDKELFIKRVLDDLSSELDSEGLDYTLERTHVCKLQSQSYDGIVFKANNNNIGITFNIDRMYEEYSTSDEQDEMYNHSLNQMVEQAVDHAKGTVEININNLVDYQYAKDRLYIDLVGIEGNEEMLKTIPHRKVEDLAIVYRLFVDRDGDGIKSTLVTNNLFNEYEIDEETLHNDALKSAQKIFPLKLSGMSEVMEELTGAPREMFLQDGKEMQYIVSNEDRYRGAGTIFYPDTFKQISDYISPSEPQNFYVLPSSIHEVIVVPDSDDQLSVERMNSIVQSINNEQVAVEDRLSNQAYHYDVEDEVFETAEKYLERKHGIIMKSNHMMLNEDISSQYHTDEMKRFIDSYAQLHQNTHRMQNYDNYDFSSIVSEKNDVEYYSNREKKVYRYYSTQRPLDIGTFPIGQNNLVNFDDREMVSVDGIRAWGYVEYNHPLDEDLINNFELKEISADFLLDSQKVNLHETEKTYTYSREKKSSQEQVKEYRQRVANDFAHVLDENEKNKQLTWIKDWSGIGGEPRSMITNKRYRGFNNFALSLAASIRGYKDPRWITFNGLKKYKDAHINKGQHGVTIQRWLILDTTKQKGEKDRIIDFPEYTRLIKYDGREETDFRAFPKFSTVFNAEQCTGIPELVIERNKDITQSEYVTKAAESMNVQIINDGGDQAFYKPMDDTIHLPEEEVFKTEYGYNATALHEIGHATGAAKRLNRNLQNAFGSDDYAFEELVAEMTSCFTAIRLKPNEAELDEYIKHNTDNHLAYVKGWAEAIRKNPECLEKAINLALLATDYIDLNAGMITMEQFNQEHRNEIVMKEVDGVFQATHVNIEQQVNQSNTQVISPNVKSIQPTLDGISLEQ